jgi:hypothetical protein
MSASMMDSESEIPGVPTLPRFHGRLRGVAATHYELCAESLPLVSRQGPHAPRSCTGVFSHMGMLRKDASGAVDRRRSSRH